MKLLILLPISFLLQSCALTEAGSKVRLASQVGPACDFIGSVSASMGSRGFDQTGSIKNAAGAMGANWVVVTSYINGAPDTGEAYKCPEMTGSARRVDKVIELNTNSTLQEFSLNNDIEFKLQKLKELKDKGLIFEEDFNQKKNQILNSL